MILALIGGGGVRTVFFCQSLAKYAEKLDITELRLMDDNEEKLDMFGFLSTFAVKEWTNVKITLTTSLLEAVQDADYVITAIRVGGDAGRVLDERTALAKGVIGQETTGPGGFSYAARTIPALLQIMEAVKTKSNHAIVFNFTNPAGLVTQAMHDAGYHNIIGICDNATGTKIHLSEALQVDASDLLVRAYGLNHLTWVDSVKLRGREILPTLMQNKEFIDKYHDFLYFDRDLIQIMGTIPNGYLYYYYHREKALANIQKAQQTRGETILEMNHTLKNRLAEMNFKKNPKRALQMYYELLETRNASYMAIELGGKGPMKVSLDLVALGIPELAEHTGVQVLEGYAGVAFNYIEALHSNRSTDLAINVPNHGTIGFLSDDDVVEVSCLVNASGAHPIAADNIPADNALLISQVKRYEKLAVQAVREKSLELGALALMANPLVGSWSLAKELMLAYQQAHQKWLYDWQ